MGKMKLNKLILLGIMLTSIMPAFADSPLWESFVNPQNDARTKLWWFHGETESTPEGIDADLKAFKDNGIGGVVYYDQVHSDAKGAFESMSPEWWAMLKHSARKAKELGLSFEVAACNGYTAGGSWITPELGLQKTDFIDTLVTVAKPTDMTIVMHHPDPWFKDIATVMFADKPELASITVPGTPLTLTDNSSAELVFNAENPIAISGISYTVSPRGKGSTGSMNIPMKPQERFSGAGYIDFPPVGELEYSLDGKTWNKATELPAMENNIGHKSRRRTVSFPAVKASMFRIKFHDWMDPDGKFKKIEISGIRLYPRDIIDNYEVKTGLRTEATYPHLVGASVGAVAKQNVKDICSYLNGDTLRIRLQPGSWRIIRFGHRPTGAKTKHGRKNLIGYEADLMSPEAAKVHFRNYLKVIYDTLSSIGCPPSGAIIDSHEAGIANWTPGFEKIFSARNGYDITPWIPALANYIVDSREETDKTLLDYRQTIAQAINNGFYATFSRLCSGLGITLTSQAMLNIDADNIASRSKADKPQGEFWAYQKNGNFDCLDASSAAHLYGKPIASGEAFTDTPYDTEWEELIRIGNLAYCRGINEFVVCASSHQPWLDHKYDDSESKHPYIYHRLNPNWAESGNFWEYQARCATMLRQGMPIVDICVYIGEELPAKTMAYKLPLIPEGYNFDVCSLDALMNRMSVRDGKIVVKGGMTYNVLVIQDRTYISPHALAKIESLKSDGAIVVRCDKGENVATALANAGISPDATIKSADLPDDKLYFYHRRSADHDIYFFYNHSPEPYQKTTTLRTTATSAELWDATSATRKKTSLNRNKQIDLSLAPYQSTFIVLPIH